MPPSTGDPSVPPPAVETMVSPPGGTLIGGEWDMRDGGRLTCLYCFDRFGGDVKETRYEGCECPSAACSKCFPQVPNCPLCHVSDATSMSSAVIMKLIDSFQAGVKFFWMRPESNEVWIGGPSHPPVGPAPPWNPRQEDIDFLKPDEDNPWLGDVAGLAAREKANLAYRNDRKMYGPDVNAVCSVFATSMLYDC